MTTSTMNWFYCELENPENLSTSCDISFMEEKNRKCELFLKRSQTLQYVWTEIDLILAACITRFGKVCFQYSPLRCQHFVLGKSGQIVASVQVLMASGCLEWTQRNSSHICGTRISRIAGSRAYSQEFNDAEQIHMAVLKHQDLPNSYTQHFKTHVAYSTPCDTETLHGLKARFKLKIQKNSF